MDQVSAAIQASAIRASAIRAGTARTGAIVSAVRGAFSDPRLFQIFALGILLAIGAWFRDFSLRPTQAILTFAAALATQWACWPLTPNKPRSLRSAIITSLSLSLLLRADNLLVHPIAAAAAISSKSIFRFREKHLFNPATFGVIFALKLLPGAWVSPGQWGQDVAIAGWVVVLGMLVTQRARRADISWAFLAFYLGALALRVAYLGQRWSVWTHQLSSGALLLFAFFMISDPMTAPNSRAGRIAHAAVVAAIAYAWQFGFYRTNGLIWALFIAAACVPLWDALWPAPKFNWTQNGGHDETNSVSTIDARDADVRRDRARQAA
ncbi:MAG: RnfABCDGE type electron transport complex subunit D [Candidatus Binatus sp.]|uniref:RnfABCDGE type electron transport complex subunit D n=1 Tax=Candidatus Binatus sp. TaxID=2811406 RepID=UPI0027286B55|nr:RnfABCDGE type electron transport complex subunit D [Candidatus Binatus sp.]MDO8433105.1 RnfABCDGE type electron transport complex subunit D [Candidatus Binatus sp.]